MGEQILWCIRAGESSEAESYFLNKNNSCIALGWNKMGDLTAIENNRESFKLKLQSTFPGIKKGAIPTTAGMLYRFRYEINIGDLAIYPSKLSKHVYIGEITGEYEYKPSENTAFPHSRKVKWIREVNRTELSQGALYEIGSALSFFQIKNYPDDFLAALSGKATLVDVVDDPTVKDIAISIEENARDFVYKRLSKELKGTPFEDFVAHILNILGYKTRVTKKTGDGGIDIIAHKDALGLEPPIIKVQVKSEDSVTPPEKVQALNGNVGTGEFGLFVALGGFSSKAKDFAKSKPNLRLIDGDELIDLIFMNYEKLDSKYKALIPMKNVYIPTPVEVDD